MGFYVNPENESKESFLEREGEFMECIPSWKDLPEGHLYVVLFDNYYFTAAGIAFNEAEYSDFTREFDSRPKKVYIVPINKLTKVAGEDWLPLVDKNKLEGVEHNAC